MYEILKCFECDLLRRLIYLLFLIQTCEQILVTIILLHLVYLLTQVVI